MKSICLELILCYWLHLSFIERLIESSYPLLSLTYVPVMESWAGAILDDNFELVH